MVVTMMMMMMTWLIEIFKHTWLRFNSSVCFFFLWSSPPIPMTLQDRYVTSSFTWWGTEERQWRVLLECKFRNSGRAFRKFHHSSPFCFCFSWKQGLSNSVDCVSATSLLVCDFQPTGAASPPYAGVSELFCGIWQLSWEEEKDQSLPPQGGR